MAKSYELPKMPYGEGSFVWNDPEHKSIRYRKSVIKNGRRVYVSVNGSTVGECLELMRKKELGIDRENNAKDRATLAELSKEWMIVFKSQTLKPRSYDTLENTYSVHIARAPFAKWQVKTISSIEIQKYLNSMIDKRTMSTIKKVKNFLDQFFKYYYRQNPYDNPMIGVTLPTKIVNICKDDVNSLDFEVLDDDEIERFISVATQPIKQGVCGYKYGWGLVFIMWSFIRYGEAIALKWSDINLEEKAMYVYKSYSRVKNRNGFPGYRWELSTTKTKSGTRRIVLCEQAIEAITEFKKIKQPSNDDELIFGTETGEPVSAKYLNDTTAKILKIAKIGKHVTPHGLRHTGISYFLRHGVSADVVAKMAGHATSAITQHVYYTVVEEQQRSEIEKINDMYFDLF